MKKDIYIARARSAVASQKMYEITGNQSDLQQLKPHFQERTKEGNQQE
jgi:hypothetical protein